MNNRERFNNLFSLKPVDRVPNYEIGVWAQTAQKWYAEGMPADALKSRHSFLHNKGKSEEIFSPDLIFIDKPMPFFGLEHMEWTMINTYMPKPGYPEQVLWESDDKRVYIFCDCCGVVHKALREGETDGMRLSMDQYMEFPVTDQKSFLEMKKRYIASLERYPKDWDEKVQSWKNNRTDPLILLYLGEFGYYSLLRRWMGTEGASYVFYDQPELVEEMFEFMTDYMIELVKKAIDDLLPENYDCFHLFEDMCFNNGPLVSPQMVRRFMLPQYKRLIDYLHKNNIHNILLDCDGDTKLLMPIWLEAGINGFLPLECKAGGDPITLRKEFGNDFFMLGGIEKFVLTKGKAAIELELKTKFDYLLPIGGYIPTLDHTVPPDVTFEDFVYYNNLKKELLAV